MPAVRVDPVTSYPLPRRGAPPRRMAVLSPRDAGRWSAVVRTVVGPLEERLDPGVVGSRAVRVAGRWRVRPLGPALREARRAAARLARARPILVATDVRSFYPSVRPEAAYRGLRAAGADHATAGRSADLLEGWGSEGYPGLPIGPPASAVVANALLAPADAALAGLPFLRWVDDSLIGVRSEAEVSRVLERLDGALEALGLERSVEKTRVSDRAVRWLGARPGLSDVR